MSHFEIEVKSLLGDHRAAERLKEKMCALDPTCVRVSTNTQLNHYFEGGNMGELWAAVKDLYPEDIQAKFMAIIERGTDFSVRTRERDGEVLLVVKAAIDEGTSANTVKRMEFEEPVNISLTELDERVLSAGFSYQAKWSREREEYTYKGANISLDKNAGYGYLAEVEKIVYDESEADAVRADIDTIMYELGIVELGQDRLARMFDYYNRNWPDYYGTDKIFVIE